ncbi:MAG: DEAD/DEAH box helicase [Puniceicoccales bacterium]|jgi:SNF2 family DNA or RNA helicase|nr:DEAD/DEAH box helicase [Puniceicoccales bacterium]
MASPASDFALKIDGSTQYLGIKLPGRGHPLRTEAMALLKRYGFQLDPLSQTWRLRDKHRVLTFLAEEGENLRKTFRAQFSPEFAGRTAMLSIARVEAEAQQKGDGVFDFSARIVANGFEKRAGENALRLALVRNQPYVETGDGRIVLFPPDVLKAAATLAKKLYPESDAAPLPSVSRSVSAVELPDLENTLDTLSVPFLPPETWRERSQALRSIAALKEAPISSVLRGRLRLYQQIGTAWLWHLYRNKLGGILADEMGLGKTVQALAFLEVVHGNGNVVESPALIVCPAALVENWCREAARFTPALRIHRHHGSAREKGMAALSQAEVVVTSYGTLTRDLEVLRRQTWSVIIADEAQHVKNRRTQNALSLRALQAEGRFVLTGTPVENSLDDLRSLFAFLMPGYLPKPAPGVSREQRAWEDLRVREKAAPYILRRAKRSVTPELPEKIEQTVFVTLEGRQADLYQEWRDRSRAEIFEMEMGGASEGRLRMLAFKHLLRLRQICDDPRLLDSKFVAGDSAKYRALREILDEAIDGGNRILVFSQFVELLQLLRRELDAEQIPSCYIDGNTRNRQAECDRFNNDPSISIFFISLKAGGVGLNLTGADTVIHYDPWWNPATEAQATDRAHRIGQTRTVTSLKLIAAGTIEERVLDLQREKATLLRDLFADSDAANASIAIEYLKNLFA